jgi:hypothetical protein
LSLSEVRVNQWKDCDAQTRPMGRLTQMNDWTVTLVASDLESMLLKPPMFGSDSNAPTTS